MSSPRNRPDAPSGDSPLGAVGFSVGCAKTALGCVMLLLPLAVVCFFIISAITHSGRSSRPCNSSSCSSNNSNSGGGGDGGDDGGDGGGDGGD